MKSFEAVKRSLTAGIVAFAIAGVGVSVASSASADQWSNDGGASAYSGPASGLGTLTWTVTATGAQVTCDVSAGLSLSNPAGVAAGSVPGLLFGVPAGGSCTTTYPGCIVSPVAASLPWSISTSGTGVTISGINVAYTPTGPSCPLAGVPLSMSGSITGSASGNTITFTNAGPLSSTFGPTTVSGSVTAEDGSGSPVELF